MAPISSLDIASQDGRAVLRGNKAVQLAAWLTTYIIAAILSLFFLSISWTAALLATTATFFIWRHFQIRKSGTQLGQSILTQSPNLEPDVSKLPAVYFLYVLGSGGHTTEMMETIKISFQGGENQHRRYLATRGDKHSKNALTKVETLISDAFPGQSGGTFDFVEVERARKVFQSWYTTPFSALASAVQVIDALTCEPEARRSKGREFKYPHVIVTNGPGTGFIVGLVVHLLKVLYLAPTDRMRVVYIETWAHIRTLSLTGKLFHWIGLADLYAVQHRELARKYNKTYIDIMRVGKKPSK